MATILEVLIQASEKAAAIARSCCQGDNEELLVAEKCGGEANARFDTDFKTIADVLAQESAKTEIANNFPELAQHVRGEECSEISGVNIKLQENSDKTAELLSSIVPSAAAKRMAIAAHTNVKLTLKDLPKDLQSINVSDLGVWIDPIDATAEFISGVRGQADAEHGLPCVTVLIGAYLRSTGEPVIGVINQPFYDNMKGRIVWGVSYGEINTWGVSDIETFADNNVILMSAAENPQIREKIKDSGWEVKSQPGAGHKLMRVALGAASAYIVSKGTTFRWDTCAPHAILKARGGDIVSYTTFLPITYNLPNHTDLQQYCNSGGLIAYIDTNVYEDLKSKIN